MLMVPIVFLFLGSETILKSIGMDPELSRNARNFCVMMIPGVMSQI